MHSIKAVKDYRNEKEMKLLDDWIERLHSNVMTGSSSSSSSTSSMATDDVITDDNGMISQDTFVAETDDDDNDDDDDDTDAVGANNEIGANTSAAIDLTGTYTTIIREYAKLKNGGPDAIQKASKMFQRMHELHDHVNIVQQQQQQQQMSSSRTTITASEVPTNTVTIDIKVNAYNLMLGLYHDSKEEANVPIALALLETMIDSWNKRQKYETTTTNDDGNDGGAYESSVPTPTDQSFAHCIGSLARMTDMEAAKVESTRLLTILETMFDAMDNTNDYNEDASSSIPSFTPSTRAYNACLDLYGRFAVKMPPSIILPMCFDIVKRMEKLSSSSSSRYSGVRPDVTTWSAILKVCAMDVDGGNAIGKAEKLETATKIFGDLTSSSSGSSVEDESGKGSMRKRGMEDGGAEVNDKIYFYMMKCVASYVANAEEKEAKMVELFTDACKKGLVNGNVLNIFKNNVSKELFNKKAGNGRLADNWVANVTSVKVQYTDGSMKGAGKNARRKGKSTSNWAKKQKIRYGLIQERKSVKDKRRKAKLQRSASSL